MIDKEFEYFEPFQKIIGVFQILVTNHCRTTRRKFTGWIKDTLSLMYSNLTISFYTRGSIMFRS